MVLKYQISLTQGLKPTQHSPFPPATHPHLERLCLFRVSIQHSPHPTDQNGTELAPYWYPHRVGKAQQLPKQLIFIKKNPNQNKKTPSLPEKIPFLGKTLHYRLTLLNSESAWPLRPLRRWDSHDAPSQEQINTIYHLLYPNAVNCTSHPQNNRIRRSKRSDFPWERSRWKKGPALPRTITRRSRHGPSSFKRMGARPVGKDMQSSSALQGKVRN